MPPVILRPQGPMRLVSTSPRDSRYPSRLMPLLNPVTKSSLVMEQYDESRFRECASKRFGALGIWFH
jgi:hypothetical protein